MSEEELLPSQVRDRVLADHEVLREALGVLRVAAKQADADSEKQLVDAFDALLAKLFTHLDMEDELLLPTLRKLDAWGPERAKALAMEHIHQREAFTKTRNELVKGDARGQELIARIEGFLDRLEKDMALEEATTLDEDLFREYPFRVDFGGS